MIHQAESNGSVDNLITSTECIYKINRKNKINNMETAKLLHSLYENKYNNSAAAETYFSKMNKYAVAAIKQGSKDSVLIEKALYYALKRQRIHEIDYAFEKLAEVAPKKAQKLREYVIKQKEEINNLNTEIIMENLKKTDIVWDKENGRYYTRDEKWQLDLNRSKANKTNINVNNKTDVRYGW